VPERLSITLIPVVVLTVSEADSAATSDGVKVSVAVQEAPAARTNPFEQVPPVLAKSALFVPVRVKNGVGRVPEPNPVLVMVTVCVALVVLCVTEPKDKGLGAADRKATTPVPDRATVPLALPETFSVAVRAPTAEGVNVSVRVQLALGGSI